jgi:hypothetical protein
MILLNLTMETEQFAKRCATDLADIDVRISSGTSEILRHFMIFLSPFMKILLKI